MFGGSEMAPKSKTKASKTCSKTDANICAKIYRIWTPSGAKIHQKKHQQISVFLARFLEASGNIDGSVETAAGVTLSPADPPGRRHIIKEYCRRINKDGAVAPDLTRLEP